MLRAEIHTVRLLQLRNGPRTQFDRDQAQGPLHEDFGVGRNDLPRLDVDNYEIVLSEHRLSGS